MSELGMQIAMEKLVERMTEQNELLTRIAESIEASAKQRNIAAVEIASQLESVASEVSELRETIESALPDDDEDELDD